MACLQIGRSAFPPVPVFRPVLSRCLFPAPFRCRLQDDASGSGSDPDGKEPPESLFIKELKRRGMTPTPLLKDTDSGRGRGEVLKEAAELGQEERNGGGPAKRNGVASAEFEKGVENQRERSMALNSEGLEGLIPRAKLLLTIGGTFVLGFWPAMLITIAFFSALYFYFGTSFVHDASKMDVTSPPYVDPYALLEDERISQTAPRLD